MAAEIKPATKEEIQAFRKDVEKPLTDIRDKLDVRDIDRVMNDDSYAALFPQWSKTSEGAVDLAVKCLKWRREHKVNDLTVESIGEETFQKGYMFLLGRDKEGGRVLYMKTGQMLKKDKEKNMQLFIFWLERIQRKEPGSRLSFIMDTTGSGLSNSDTGFVKFIIESFTSYFPCMLRRTVVYNLPTILNAMWKLISKILSQEQRDATVLCGKSEIGNYVNKDNLPPDMGGEMTFEYTFPPFPDDLEK